MLADTFHRVERVLAAITALLLFTLNEVRMFKTAPHTADPATGQVFPAFVRVLGGSGPIYLTWVDMLARWGLVSLTLALCLWAVAETLPKAAANAR